MAKAKILCVDDIADNLDILTELLSDSYEVAAALNAQTALKILEKHTIDMILLDIMMPDVDGFTFASQLKCDERFKNIPLLFISAKSDEESIERGYELGAADYVSKPFKPKELLARVRTHLKLNGFIQSLEEQVEQALCIQREQEHLLIKQSYAASMGEMIDAIAHQWKQPLNNVNMRISNLLLDYQDDMIDEEYIVNFKEKSLSQIRHLVSTLNDFRSFMSPHKQKELFSVQKMLTSCMVLIGDELKFHNINVEINTQNDFEIDAIENEFLHIVLNILNNAKEALLLDQIQSPCIQIEVDSKNRVIKIIDNANGINDEDMESIFDLHFTRKKTTGGSGLGLYMSQMIIHKYGGEISVSNLEDSGAMFSIII